MNNESFKIPVTKIGPNMVLSKDVVTQDGLVLIAKNTSLDNVNVRKLRALGIDYVTIKPAVPKKPIRPRVVPQVIEKVEFKSFEGEYEQRADEYKSLVQDISSGKNVDIKELYKLTDGIMQNLRLKSDVFTFVNYIKQADEHIFTHSINVSILCNIFANWLKLNQKTIIELTVAGLLHDIGMVKVHHDILNKTEPLTAKEFDKIKEHATDGYRLLANQKIPDAIKVAVLMHHERMDGMGYPLKATSEKISSYAKILSICDTYDAMTSDRPYRKKMSPFKVIRTLETGMYAELDTQYLLIFLENIAYNYLGSWVRLSDGRPAEIVFINRLNISKPILRSNDEEMIDLATRDDLEIEALL